jgi:ferrous iron transport protein B
MLASPILALGLPTLLLLNMSDLLAARGGKVDPLALAQELRCPVALISASHGTNIDTITAFLQRAGEPAAAGTEAGYAPVVTLPVLQNPVSCRKWSAQVTEAADYRHPRSPIWTIRLDKVLLNRFWGPLVFLAVVISVFQVVFTIGQPLSDGLGAILTNAGAHVANALPDNWLRPLLRDGLWNGVQAVLVFLPQILLLFLFIGILEDSGYLARAALIADRLMRAIGLNGKAFIPLLSAYACAVPARPAGDDPGRAIHDVLCAAADLYADHRGVYSRQAAARPSDRAARLRDAWALCPWLSGCVGDGAPAQVIGAQGVFVALHSGTAAVSLAHGALA